MLDEKLYYSPTRVLRNFPMGSHADLASSTKRSRVLIKHSCPLLNVPAVRALGIVFERNMAPRCFGKRSNEFLASVWLVIIVLTAANISTGAPVSILYLPYPDALGSDVILRRDQQTG